MAWDLKIDDVSKKAVVDTKKKVVITLAANERSTMKFTTVWSENYNPARFLPAVAYDLDGTTPLFNGFVFRRKAKGKGTSSFATEVTCLDYWYFLDRTEVVLEYSEAVSIEQVVTDVVAQLPGSYGITVDGDQATGPTIAAFSFRGTATNALKHAGQQAPGWITRLSATKTLRIMAPGTDAAPYVINDADSHCIAIETDDSDTPPSNRVVLWCGPTGEALATQEWEADGVQTSWQTDIPAAAAPPIVTVDDGVSPLQATVGAGAMFEFDLSTSTLSAGTYGTPANGVILTLGPTAAFPSFEGYIGRFPFKVEATTGATPVLTETRQDATITNYANGVEAAANLLASVNQSPETVKVESRDHGWRPGQELTIDLTAPPIDSVYNIGPVTITLTTDESWVYSFTASEATVFQGSRFDVLRRTIQNVAGGASAGNVTVIGGGGGSSSGGFSAFLGGAQNAATTLSHTEWRTISNRVRLSARSVAWSAKIRAEVRTRNAGITFKLRLWNVDDETETDVSSFITPGNDPDDPGMLTMLTVVPADVDHVLQIIGEDSGDNGEDAYVVATVVEL